MQEIVTMHQAKTQLSKLVAKVQSGEVVLIGAYGQAKAKLVPLDYAPRRGLEIGRLKGRLTVPEGFDAPLEDAILQGICQHI